METGHRRTQSDLKHRLQAEPESFQALQLFRLLNALDSKKVRINSAPQLSFAASEISAVKDREKSWDVTCNATNLFGAQGIMPQAYSEELIRLQKTKNFALQDFLNIINDRYFQLLYQAWCKNKPCLMAEQKTEHKLAEILKALSGFSPKAAQSQLTDNNHAHLRWAGQWARPIRSAAGLKQALSQQFGLKVNIEQFIPSQTALEKSAQTRISRSNHFNNQLGMSSLLGETSWQVQYRFAVHIEVNSQIEFETLMPDSARLEAIKKWVALYVGQEQQFSIKLLVNKDVVPVGKIQQQNLTENQLGWGMQLSYGDTLHPTEQCSKQYFEIEYTQSV